MASLPNNPSETLRKLNPHLYGAAAAVTLLEKAQPKQKRLRQNAKPLMNKLEQELFNYLQRLYPKVKLHAQAKTYRLANGVRYTPDFTALLDGKEWAWEAKGPKAWEDSLIKLKVAASAWPEVCWTLMWKENDGWRSQIVLP